MKNSHQRFVFGAPYASSLFSKAGNNFEVAQVRVQNSFNARMWVSRVSFQWIISQALSQVLRQPQVYLLLPLVPPYTSKAGVGISAYI